MVAQARPEPAAAAEQESARSTREELAQAPAQDLAQKLGQVLGRETSASQDSASALAEAASPAWLAESASSRKQNSTACSGCSPSLAKRKPPRVHNSTSRCGS